MIPRVVTFVGNCQAEAFARFYREFCIDDDEADVEFIDIAALNENNFARPGSLRRLRATRILVEQVFDWPRPLDDHIGPACERFTFPTATLWFLWPHTGVPHPRNEDASVPGAPVSPPYPAEYGDGFLNRLIKAEMPPAVAVHRYLELDIVKRTNLPSRFEKEMDLIGRRDSQPRIGLRDEISAHFRDEALFRTRGHPNLRIFSLIATSLFRRMGVDGARIEIGLRSLHEAPFPPTELPVHPKIAEHFGLSYGGPATRYRYFLEGSFTFAEYADRYMRFTFNPALRRLVLSRDLPPEQQLTIADQAVASSPGSAFALRYRAKLLWRLGQPGAAIEAARQACAVAPGDPESWYDLAVLLHQQRDDACEQVAKHAVALHPHHAGALKLLGRLALQTNLTERAVTDLRAATLYAPRDTEARSLYAEALARSRS